MKAEARPAPSTVRELAQRLCATVQTGDIRLTQKGRMRQDPASSWMNFSATQTISTTECSFDWRARTGPFGMISVRDALVDGEGALDVKALGFIPIAHINASPALTRGELMRYLAELPLAPAAILANPSLSWRSDGADRLIVSAGIHDKAAEVSFTLDGEGRIATIFANRPRGLKNDFTSTPWHGRFTDYRQRLGVWLPFAAEVGWTINGAEFIYWEGRMQSWAVSG